MKLYWVVILLLGSCLCEDKFSNIKRDFTGTMDSDKNREQNPFAHVIKGNSKNSYIRRDNENIANEKHYNYIGNPDNDAIIIRPCSIYDLNCIRSFFGRHANCTIAYGPMPDSVIRSQTDAYFARVNITATANNFLISGLSSTRIEEFYINKATSNMVFAINVRNFVNNSTDLYLRFHRRGKEPVVTLAPTGILFPSVTFTAIIPFVDELQLEKAEVTAYCDTGVPPFYVGPQVVNSTDPTVTSSFSQLLADIPTNVQEYFLTQAFFYPAFYIQYNICDFHLKVL